MATSGRKYITNEAAWEDRMKNIRLILGTLFVFLTNTAHADLFSFDGSLTVIDPTGALVANYPAYTGQINYDTVTQTGSANFDPVVFKGIYVVIHDVDLTQTGGTIHADGLWDFGVSIDQSVSWDWTITALPGGATSFALIDTDSDGIPGTAFTDGPFPGFTMAIEGIASPVPLPAAVWLFGSGLLGLVGMARHNA